MKNLVFPEFVEFAEARFGFSPAPGEEGDSEYARLLMAARELSRARTLPECEILRGFGSNLFRRMAVLCPIFFGDTDSAFEFLANIDRRLHEGRGEFRSQVWFPALECSVPERGRLEILFHSDYPIADLAAGLIEGCGEYYDNRIHIERRDVPAVKGHTTLFVVTRSTSCERLPSSAGQNGNAAGSKADSEEIFGPVTPFPAL